MNALLLPQLRQVPSPNYSSRGGAKVTLLVAHDCEGSYAGSLNWFSQPKSKVSAHLVLSENGLEATQMVSFANKAWHACDFNPMSIGIEMAGFAAKGFAAPEWQAAANIFAFLLHRYGLPPHWVQNGEGQGFCSHYNLGQAGGGHKDPTTDSGVWDAFCARVEAAYALGPPDAWGAGTPATVPSAPAGFTPSTTVRHDAPIGSLEWVQLHLNAAGAKPVLNVDGLVGPATERAVIAYQRAHGLTITGDPQGAQLMANLGA